MESGVSRGMRKSFLDYFQKAGHTLQASSPVVPQDDPTLLFTNAGMNQFKDVFLGEAKREYVRAATSQKCIRVGGKHNDLDNVGHTRRHLTFFEMLGNFSFGDYFKEDAIRYAWEVATKVWGFDADRIWPTVFRDDEEAFEMWRAFVPAERITRFGEAENFWSMGETGPCGPCSELLYDRGAAYGSAKNPKEDVDGERYLEFWNLVFMQFNRQADGKMTPLPKPSIDTGSGLERVVSLKMNVDNVFQTDILGALVQGVQEISGRVYDPRDKEMAPAFHVIADHMRCLSFAIADGAQPGNVDRGYVLRKVVRRAVRYGKLLGLDKPFLGRLTDVLIREMGNEYPELKVNRGRIEELLTTEEESFIRTLRRGGNIMADVLDHARRHGHRITGEDAFRLKDTYGFPLEEVTLIAKDAELTVDLERYRELEEEARQKSRSAHKTVHQVAADNLFIEFADRHGATEFTGYTHNEDEGKVLALVVEGAFVEEVKQGQSALVILDRTPFYAEMGGQVGDTGRLWKGGAGFSVENTEAPCKGLVGHRGVVEEGALKVGDRLHAAIDEDKRRRIEKNHTATHLLHWALQTVLGDHVRQAGSVVEADRLRFDFNHHKALTEADILAIEDLVNDKIRENKQVAWYELSFADVSKRDDIKQFFGEKYGSRVRVVDIDFSKELCGGCHTALTGNIGLFRIVKEGSIAAGVRRIEAVTGQEAIIFSRAFEQRLHALAEGLKTKPHLLEERVAKLVEENRVAGDELKEVRKGKIVEMSRECLRAVEMIGSTPVIGFRAHMGSDELRLLADATASGLSSGVLVLAGIADGRCQLIVRVTNDLVAKGIKANEIVKELAPLIGGGGGGKADSAQAGGTAPEGVDTLFQRLKSLF